LWLEYITSSNVQKSYNVSDTVSDTVSSTLDLSGGTLPSHGTFPGGGGGMFGGGGASGSFDSVGAHINIGMHDVLSEAATHTGHGLGETVGNVAGEAASGIADDGVCVLAILGILLTIVFGLGLYVVYDAPFILSEVAFDFILAASLVKSTRKIDDPDWKGSVLRTTWKPFVAALLISFVGAVIIHATYPAVHKISEIYRR
jgi:hypothetical protein